MTMKKTFALILMLMIALCAFQVSYASKPGDTVSVTVSITGAGQLFGIYIDYPAELQFVSTNPSVGYAGAHRWGQAQLGSIGSAECTYTFRIASDAKPGTYTVTASMEEGSGTVSGGTVTVDEPVHTHSPEKVTGKAATCEEAGLTDGEKCSVCGEVLKEQETIPALGHQYKKEEPASLKKSVYVCERCGDRYMADETNTVRNFYGSILINANEKNVEYAASVDPENDLCLVITAEITPEIPDWTSEIGLYLNKDLIKQFQEEGFEYVTYVNGNAALTFALTGIDDTLFETKEEILQYAVVTDPEAENGCMVKVEGVIENDRIPAGKFAPMELKLDEQKIEVTEAGVYSKTEETN